MKNQAPRHQPTTLISRGTKTGVTSRLAKPEWLLASLSSPSPATLADESPLPIIICAEGNQ